MTAIRKGISNEPSSGEIKNITDLCYGILEPVRAKFDKPIIKHQVIDQKSCVLP